MLDCPELALKQTYLNFERLRACSRVRLNQVLRIWLQQQGLKAPTTRVLNTLVETVLFARADAAPSMRLDGALIRRYRETLYLDMCPEAPLPKASDWLHFPKPLTCKAGVFLARPAQAGLYVPEGAQVSVRYRAGGEQLVWQGHTRTLKYVFQKQGIPPWLRDTVPLIFIDGALAAVLDFMVGDDYYKVSPEPGELIYALTQQVEEVMHDPV